jgi:hypothetical protein
MSKAPLEQPAPSSEAETLLRPKPTVAPDQANSEQTSSASPSSSPTSFAAVEGPTLSSPSLNSESKLSTIAALESRVEALESRLAATERELADVYGAVEHVVAGQENLETKLKQQRHGRYLMWGTLIVILVVFWATLQTRLGIGLPH